MRGYNVAHLQSPAQLLGYMIHLTSHMCCGSVFLGLSRAEKEKRWEEIEMHYTV